MMPETKEALVSACQAALLQDRPQDAICAIIRALVANPDKLAAWFGKPEAAGFDTLHVADDLTIINVNWAPGMTVMPHNHNTWAVIGVYTGREDNIFWRRVKGATEKSIEAAGALSIGAAEAVTLGKDLIHSVTNPTSVFTSAIHVYGANFFEIPRSEWDPMVLTEKPYDMAKNIRRFEGKD